MSNEASEGVKTQKQLDKEKNLEAEKQNKIKEKKVKKILSETEGYINKDQFVADILGDNVYADAREYGIGEGSLSYNPNSPTETTMSHIDVPWFEDGDVNEYLYKDMIKNAPKSLGARFGEFVGYLDDDYYAEYARYEGDDGKSRLRKDLLGFGEKNNVFKIVNDKNSDPSRLNYETKYVDQVERQLQISNNLSQGLTEEDEEIRALYQNGEWDKAVSKSKDKGYVLLYNQDGKSILWEDLSEEDKKAASPDDIKLVNGTIEEKASTMAATMGTSDRSKAMYEREQLTYELLGITSLIAKNYSDPNNDYGSGGDDTRGMNIYYGTDNTNHGFQQNQETIQTILQSGANNELTGNLRKLKGDRPLIQQYNKYVEDLHILNRAIEINTDLSLLPEEVLPGIDPSKWTDRMDLDADAYETRFKEVFNDMGYEMTDERKIMKVIGVVV